MNIFAQVTTTKYVTAGLRQAQSLIEVTLAWLQNIIYTIYNINDAEKTAARVIMFISQAIDDEGDEDSQVMLRRIMMNLAKIGNIVL